MINLFSIVFLAAFVSLAGCQTTEMSSGPYDWPDYQAGLAPGASNSPVKAMLPRVMLEPAADETAPERAAFGGVWEGWLGRDKTIDIIVAVRKVTNNGAKVDYSVGSASFDKYNTTISSRFVGDTLQGTFGNGARLILSVRSDGHMNVKYELGSAAPTGIMQRTQAPPST